MSKNKKIIIRFIRAFAFVLILLCLALLGFSQTSTRGATITNVQSQNSEKTKAIIVGVSKYKNVESLNYADSDAKSFYKYLISDAGGNIDSTNIILLTNDQATSANIYSSLDAMVDGVKEGDKVIIYFSGHGDLESKTIRQNGFLLCHDSPKNCYMAGGTIGVGYLQDYLETIASKSKSEVLLITDACRSGKLAGGAEGAQNTSAALSQSWQNITKILSSQPGEYSFESNKWGKGAGVFTFYLIRGMTGLADRNNNSEVNTQELYLYLLENIGKETNFAQNPIVVGNMTSLISNVDSYSLANLKKSIDNVGNEVLASKGFNNYSSSLAADELLIYMKFRYCIENDQLIPDDKNLENAWNLYLKLNSKNVDNQFKKQLKRSLLAALQNKSQTAINLYLSSVNIEDSIDVNMAISELHYAKELITPDYILYDDIKGRLLLFQTFEPSPLKSKIALLKEAIKLRPDAAYLYNEIAKRYSEDSQYDNALECCSNAISLAPNWAYPYFTFGNIYRKEGKYDKATESFIKAIELKPDFSEAYNNLGNIYEKKGMYEEASKNYQNAIKIKPDFYQAHNNLGTSYFQLNKINEAIEAYNKALKIYPDYFEAYNNIGNAYMALDQPENAIKNFKRAIEINPEFFEAYNNIGNAYSSKGSNENAIQYYLKAIELKPDYNDAYINLGLLHKKSLDNNEAVKYLNKSLTINANNIEVISNLADIYYSDKKYSDAVKLYRKAIKLNKDNSLAHFKLGKIYYETGKNDSSLYFFSKVIEMDPENPSLFYNIGNIYFSMGETDKAIESYQKAISYNSDYANAYYNLGIAYSNKGDIDKAIETLLKANKADPNDPWTCYSISGMYSIKKNIDKSKYWFEESLKKGMNDWEYIKEDPNLMNFRKEESYQALINKYTNTK